MALLDEGIHYETASWLGRSNHIQASLAALSFGGLELNAEAAAQAGWLGKPSELKAMGQRALAGIEKLGKAAPAETAVFSSEFFSFWLRDRAELTALHQMMTAHFTAVRYIAYIREPVSHAESDYNQFVKSGLTDDFRTFALGYPDKISEWVDRVMILGELAGAGAIDLRVFDTTTFVGGNVIEDFCSAIGLKRLPSTEFPASNTSLNMSGIKLLRAVNRAMPADMSYDQAHAIRQDLIPTLREISDGAAKLRMGPDLANEVFEAGTPHLERLRKAICPENPSFFGRPSRTACDAAAAIDEEDSAELKMMANLVLKVTQAAERRATPSAIANMATKKALGSAKTIGRQIGNRLRVGNVPL